MGKQCGTSEGEEMRRPKRKTFFEDQCIDGRTVTYQDFSGWGVNKFN
jgi:hypothetical protein